MLKKAEKNGKYYFILFLWVLNSFLRIVFGTINITEGSQLDVAVSPLIVNFITIMFYILGVCGFIVTYGLLRMNQWGFKGTIIVSLATIIFDIWGITIQITAALGFITPGIALVYLLINKENFRTGGV